jgi:hypothetical protein
LQEGGDLLAFGYPVEGFGDPVGRVFKRTAGLFASRVVVGDLWDRGHAHLRGRKVDG